MKEEATSHRYSKHSVFVDLFLCGYIKEPSSFFLSFSF